MKKQRSKTLSCTEEIQRIVVEFVKKTKKPPTVEVSSVEQKDGMWIVRGTCPIDLEGHPWREMFVIKLDKKGRIRETDFSLL